VDPDDGIFDGGEDSGEIVESARIDVDGNGELTSIEFIRRVLFEY
jgi:uncharacterized protein YuzE